MRLSREAPLPVLEYVDRYIVPGGLSFSYENRRGEGEEGGWDRRVPTLYYNFLFSSVERKSAVLNVGLRRGCVGMRSWVDWYVVECLEGGGVMMEVKVVSSVLPYRKDVKGWGGVGCSSFVR